MLYHIVLLPDGNQMVVSDDRIEDGVVEIRRYDDENEPYDKKVQVEIIISYLVNVSADFVRDPKRNNSLIHSVGHLAYFYSISIVRYSFENLTSCSKNDLIYFFGGLEDTRHFIERYLSEDEDGLDFFDMESLKNEVLTHHVDLDNILLSDLDYIHSSTKD